MILPRAFNASPVPTEAHVALVLAGFIALVVFQSIALVKGQDFSAAAFGEAMGILLGGGGVAAFGQGFLTRSRTHAGTAGMAQAGASAKPDNPDA
jgi:hypothetical protein